MFKHILLPVDGSPTADLAVDKALAIAQAFQSHVSVICVVDPYAFTGVGTDLAYNQADYLSAVTAEADAAITPARERLQAHGVEATGSNPGGSDSTRSPWLIQTSSFPGRPRRSAESPRASMVAGPYSR